MRLSLEHISKSYPGVKANDDISLTVAAGEIHAVLGENGAGKSTLMKIIYGAVQPDAGQILWEGRPVRMKNPGMARDLGIAMVYQHFSLFDTLTAAENIWLGLGRRISLSEVETRITDISARYGLDCAPRRPVHTLSVGERQRVEIIRCLLAGPRLLILDEPTSVLTPQAVEKLFVVLRQLAADGCSILYISHKLDEIRSLCHHCTVLRGGRVSGRVDPARETEASLSRLMIGADPPALQHRPSQPGAVLLQVDDLQLPGDGDFSVAIEHLSLQVRAGEILGIAGVSGNGQQELLAAMSGEDRRARPAAVKLAGEPVGALGPGARRKRGLHFIPEERLGRATVPVMSLEQNMLLTARPDEVASRGLIRRQTLREQAQAVIVRFGVKAGGPQAAARSLSGGNLQKFIVGREILGRPRVLIVAQPTWGVDVGAAAQIRAELLALRDAGCAVLVVSEELDELFEIADRLQVMARGKLSPSIARAEATVERIGLWMSGLWPQGANQPEEVADVAA
ncbi:MAG: ABC transporter ATP-binding protein [Thiomonas sp.]|uniref:ABC transporter ATP-binding protein n=1 Tax=Thiomonas sp. TaxID=2047785 RepID=UPI002A360467|nr:ABC transporter ATP-binding protein [Thiomonas sp.]MDY0329855.1 ABC transporter ATP-binding protein [Thiomonas sp.]